MAHCRPYREEKEAAREYVIELAEYLQNVPVSYGELAETQAIIERLAKRYGLVTELKENGIL